jgi:S-DNA-T family DNA segregation ATPase FtsK/SpoIIIE
MIVVVIDEMADLMIVAGKEIEAAVQRLAQMARARASTSSWRRSGPRGRHHRHHQGELPDAHLLPGHVEDRQPHHPRRAGRGAALGQGDMLHMAGGGRVNRVHGPFVSDEEVERVVAYLREQGEPNYIEEVTETEDEDGDSAPVMQAFGGEGMGERGLYEQAVALVSREGKASTSFVQRHLNIGYNRAAKLIEQMEKDGIVGPANHVGKRDVLRPAED